MTTTTSDVDAFGSRFMSRPTSPIVVDVNVEVDIPADDNDDDADEDDVAVVAASVAMVLEVEDILAVVDDDEATS